MVSNNPISAGSRWVVAQPSADADGPKGRTEPRNRPTRCHKEPKPWEDLTGGIPRAPSRAPLHCRWRLQSLSVCSCLTREAQSRDVAGDGAFSAQDVDSSRNHKGHGHERSE